MNPRDKGGAKEGRLKKAHSARFHPGKRRDVKPESKTEALGENPCGGSNNSEKDEKSSGGLRMV